MGVAGAGKSTLGRALADRLGWAFLEADDFHSAENVAQMRSGKPLGAAQRRPWIQAIAEAVVSLGHAPAVLACSALSSQVRDQLEDSSGRDCAWILLDISPAKAEARLAGRAGHFMPPSLVASQFEALEVPEEARVLDAMASVEDNLRILLGP